MANRSSNKSVEPLLTRLLEQSDVDDVLEAVPELMLGAETIVRKEAERHLLSWGGMPELLPLDDAERREWLKSYDMAYLERDLSALSRMADLLPFRKFHRLAALRSAQLLNYSELARNAGTSVETARRYLEHLRVSYQAWLLEPFSRNLTSRGGEDAEAVLGGCRALAAHDGDVWPRKRCAVRDVRGIGSPEMAENDGSGCAAIVLPDAFRHRGGPSDRIKR